jgi:hypothetical protein
METQKIEVRYKSEEDLIEAWNFVKAKHPEDPTVPHLEKVCRYTPGDPDPSNHPYIVAEGGKIILIEDTLTMTDFGQALIAFHGMICTGNAILSTGNGKETPPAYVDGGSSLQIKDGVDLVKKYGFRAVPSAESPDQYILNLSAECLTPTGHRQNDCIAVDAKTRTITLARLRGKALIVLYCMIVHGDVLKV